MVSDVLDKALHVLLPLSIGTTTLRKVVELVTTAARTATLFRPLRCPLPRAGRFRCTPSLPILSCIAPTPSPRTPSL